MSDKPATSSTIQSLRAYMILRDFSEEHPRGLRLEISQVKTRRIIRYTFGICGIVLFVYLIRRVGLTRILDSAQQIGWGTLAIIVIGGGILLVRSVAWRCTLGREYRNLPIS